MKVRMKVGMSGTRNGEAWPKLGEVAELPTAEAAHYVAAGIAERVEDAPRVETATAPDPEVTEAPAPEVTEQSEAESRGKRGRPKLPRDSDGNVIRE